MRQAVILAGGAGKRLRERLGDLPKPMAPIGGKPLTEHQIELAIKHGVDDFIFLLHNQSDCILNHFGDGHWWKVRFRYLVEPYPRGTAGAVLAALPNLADRFFVLYGDIMTNVDLERMWEAHEIRRADVTIAVHPNDHPLDSDLVEVSPLGRITAFHNRPHRPGTWRQNLVSAGIYVVEKESMESLAFPDGPLDFGSDIFPMLGCDAKLMTYRLHEYAKDIGAPERYDRVCAEFENGVVDRMSMDKPQRAVFLDRDGTLIKEKNGLKSADELELLPTVAEAICELNHAGWRAVVVTNQPVIAKGFCTESEMQLIHNKLETLLGMEHAYLDGIYYCPHHPESGFEGERKDLKIDCDCRKPRIGMIQKAASELNIDITSSWMIGDTSIDAQTAYNAGMPFVLVPTLKPGYANVLCNNLLDAVRIIQKETA